MADLCIFPTFLKPIYAFFQLLFMDIKITKYVKAR